MSPRAFVSAALLTCALTSAVPAGAQVAVSVYVGDAITANTNVTLSLPGEPSATYAGVSWRSESFVAPIYYGLRLTYWLGRESNFGVGLDFTHAKMLANDDSVLVTRDGDPDPSHELLSETLNYLGFSHGHNLLTLNLYGRVFPKGERDRSIGGRLQPYGGLGLGVAIPHVEVDLVDGGTTGEYQITGLALVGLVGASFDVINRLAVFLEYKLNWAKLNGELSDGGTVGVKPWTHQFLFGASFSVAPTLP